MNASGSQFFPIIFLDDTVIRKEAERRFEERLDNPPKS